MNTWRLLLVVSCLIAGGLTPFVRLNAQPRQGDSAKRIYIGTYTGPKSQGIYTARFDPVTGKISLLELAVKATNPSFLALHPKQPLLYAVGESGEPAGFPEGVVSVFEIDKTTGKLTLLNQQPSGGAGPCHLSIDPTGRCALVANYGSGSIAALPIQPDGRLSPPTSMIQHQGSSVNPQRQTGPHAHFITADPRNRFVLACDLGLDKVLVYKADTSSARLTPNTPPWVSVQPGLGPRHLVFHPNGKFVFLLNELGAKVTAFSYDPKHGWLTEFQNVSTLPAEFKGDNICAEVQVHPSGRFLYASNRGHDSIAVFEVNPKTRRLEFVEHQPTLGRTPRHFVLDPSGRWLLVGNQDSDNIVVFHVDPKTGRLTNAGKKAEAGSPVCIVFARP